MSSSQDIMDPIAQQQLMYVQQQHHNTYLQMQAAQLYIRQQTAHILDMEGQLQRMEARNQEPPPVGNPFVGQGRALWADITTNARGKRKRKYQKFLKSCVEKIPEAKRANVDIRLEGGFNLNYNFTVNGESDDEGDEQPDEKLSQLLHVKDRYFISDEAVHELHMMYANIPSLNRIKKKRQESNSYLSIENIDNVSTFYILLLDQE